MPSSKGKPTDPKKREEAKKEVLQMEKGGGKGQWSAWKAAEMAKVYEAKGGDYENTGDNPNKAEKGDPKPKESAVKKGERKPKGAPVGEKKETSAKKAASNDKKTKSSTSKSTSSASAKKKDTGKGAKTEAKKTTTTTRSGRKVSAAA
ncbi:uncharacterized protein FA14DRAFT_151368 [Meira miltonrushii]|uniref:Hypervirulence associated protein TUDOR domain-containing protein n=1 Tax=Meira miltonrushii TaxID=1280837 RepID=A0A316V2S0_9BASI|nr:uncharacterized protein FA14DRAFT_151368 [Meira miltonrushii]PWN31857.1 hypothetical protein FA14DRAFT_151368 [Meira miltonrushii]